MKLNGIWQGLASFGTGFLISSLIFKDIPKTLAASSITASASVALESLIPRLKKSKSEDNSDQSTSEENLIDESVAIYWDLENIGVSVDYTVESLVSSIHDYAQQQGHLRLKKVYANWKVVPRQVGHKLTELGFDQVQVSMGKQNSVDVKLAVDCLSAAQEMTHLDHFILVSADKDFISLIHRLKSLKKKVTVIAYSNSVSNALRNGADVFVPLDELKEPQAIAAANRKMPPPENAISYDQAIAYLKQAIALAQSQNKPLMPSRLAELMQQLSQGLFRQAKFIQTANGKRFKTFKDFLKAAAETANLDPQTISGNLPVALATTVPSLNEGAVEVFPEGELFISEPDEDPTEVSTDPIPLLKPDLSPAEWHLVVAQLNQAFAPGNPLKFMALLFHTRQLKKEGQLNQPERVLKQILQYLIQAGLLDRGSDGGFFPGPSWATETSALINPMPSLELSNETEILDE
ncbi:MAG: NYN domain-containing protein [Thermosynechococcaceae cyanobacterium]